jgi:phosphoribosylformylglycinamidine synthase
VITLPIAHGEGCYYADQTTLKALQANHQILFRYCNIGGEIDAVSNPNGSVENIAGICNPQGNVVGMMPHPERASDPTLGYTDGLKLFQGLLASSAVQGAAVA